MEDTHRDKQRALMARIRRAEIEIEIPAIKNPRRRRKCGTDPERFCRTYFEQVCYNPFTPDQKIMIQGIVGGIKHGGRRAIAAARGDGKSSITRVVSAWAIINGYIKFVVLIGANAKFGKAHLKDLKEHFETNDLLMEDYPEICAPVRALEGAAQRAKTQIAEGSRTELYWGSEEVTFPKIAGSQASGGIMIALGMESAIRGLVRGKRRPDLVILDDIETQASARSETELQRNREVIDKDVQGLAGPGKQIASVLLCTIQRKGCVADEYTDRDQRPAWHGIRQKFLLNRPDNEDLWNKYVELRNIDHHNNDETGRTAHKFYLKHRKEMDIGAKVNNPYRFNGQELPDGSRQEVSAIQCVYNLVADANDDWATFNSEYQNDPADDINVESTQITVKGICNRLNRLERGVVPNWCEKLTAAIDVHGRVLYWSVVAWGPGVKGAVVDYGTEKVFSPQEGKLLDAENIKETQAAILTAIIEWREWEENNGWPRADTGEVVNIDLGVVDAGWMPDPVYRFCVPSGKFRPTKGFGTSGGQSKYRPPVSRGGPKRQGAHWHSTRRSPRDPFLYNIDSDYYKNAVHGGLVLADNLPGSISLFGDEPVIHRAWAEQIVSEKWTREFKPGKGWQERFVVHSRHNHDLDCLAGNRAAADMLGLRILGEARPAKKVKLSEIQANRRAGR